MVAQLPHPNRTKDVLPIVPVTLVTVTFVTKIVTKVTVTSVTGTAESPQIRARRAGPETDVPDPASRAVETGP